MQSIANTIKSRIYGNGRGWAFTPSHFVDLGSDEAVRKALSRLEREGLIRRLSFGLYDYPENHPVLGELPPNVDKVGKAIAYRYSIKLQPSGAYAANLLGLSEQVPAKIVFLTDGETKTISVGNRKIYLKKTTPKNMKTANSITGLVIQALRYIGKENISDEIIKDLKRKLTSEDYRRIQREAHLAPAWIRKIIKTLIEEDDR